MEKIFISKNIFELKNSETKSILEKYLEEIKKYVLENDVDLEIYEDLKGRIEEKLVEIREKEWEINKNYIKSMIKEIWNPDEIFSVEKDKKEKWFNFKIPKFEKFYKYSKEWKILWVCYWLWKTLGIEPIWIRIFFIILFMFATIFSIILYIVLALILPDKSEKWKVEINSSWLEWIIKRFFVFLYEIWQKVISFLK